MRCELRKDAAINSETVGIYDTLKPETVLAFRVVHSTPKIRSSEEMTYLFDCNSRMFCVNQFRISEKYIFFPIYIPHLLYSVLKVKITFIPE